MTTLLSSQNLITALKTHRLEFDEKIAGSVWRVCLGLAPEDGVWLGTAAARDEADTGSELRALRYGSSAEEALFKSVYTLREAIDAFESRRSK